MPANSHPSRRGAIDAEPPRFLRSDELASIASSVDLAQTIVVRMATRDIREIDAKANAALLAWTEHPLRAQAPSIVHHGGLVHLPARSELERQFTPEEHWSGWNEAVSHEVQGARVGSWNFLFLFGGSTHVQAPGWRPTPPARWSLWAVEHGSSKLVGLRGLPLDETARLTSDSIGDLLAQAERARIGETAPPAPPSLDKLRL